MPCCTAACSTKLVVVVVVDVVCEVAAAAAVPELYFCHSAGLDLDSFLSKGAPFCIDVPYIWALEYFEAWSSQKGENQPQTTQI